MDCPWFMAKQFSDFFGSAITSFGRNHASQTTKCALSKIHDPLLKAILAAQWPDYGSPPSESAFGLHAVVTADYFRGGYYPMGGSKKIAEGAVSAIEGQGAAV